MSKQAERKRGSWAISYQESNGLKSNTKMTEPLMSQNQRDSFSEVLVQPRSLFLLRHKDGGGLLLKKYTQDFEEEGLTITM